MSEQANGEPNFEDTGSAGLSGSGEEWSRSFRLQVENGAETTASSTRASARGGGAPGRCV